MKFEIRNLKATKEKEDEVLVRLKKIQGQIGGIIKMYEKEKGCSEIVQQIIAVKSALEGVVKLLLTSEAVRCVKKPTKEFKKSLENLLKYT